MGEIASLVGALVALLSLLATVFVAWGSVKSDIRHLHDIKANKMDVEERVAKLEDDLEEKRRKSNSLLFSKVDSINEKLSDLGSQIAALSAQIKV